MSKYIELAKKLKILSEQGVAGERYNAQKMLDNLIRKHNISFEQIESEKKEQLVYIVKKSQARLFSQVVYSVLGKEYEVRVSIKHPTQKWVMSTKSQEIEIRLKFDFYWKAYQKQLEIFYQAFLQKNSIFPDDPELKLKESELTEEEKERRRRIVAMAIGMEKEEFLKLLKA